MTTSMTTTLQQVLGEALDDEYKARATYEQIIRDFGPVRPFSQIVAAEDRHVQALLRLYEKYSLPVPPDPWRGQMTAPASLLEASRAAAQAEIDNDAMYRRLLAASRNYPDVQGVLGNLQRASRENHLPAFQQALQRHGATRSNTDYTAATVMQPAPSAPAARGQGHWNSGHAAHGVSDGCRGGGGHGWGGGHGCGGGRWGRG